ncbi:hypothetical protein CROQUDRAFT_656182 [Cronartium quercuum f. sp. fusiforme G11]|uniref:Magnesium transporter n=1 Tax=Cronartium quercuum f. sp. fusiforme G11 TaxID=708437 RepID=A0A9P6NNM1_9BASI|nr:hypothetical protein CROQUDRAFT_656182 [Cronartium quercuum f. sp. fusiforme G11]
MSNSTSLVGIVIAVCGNICISIALNLQKLAHQKIETNHSPLPSPTKPSSEINPQSNIINERTNLLSNDHHQPQSPKFISEEEINTTTITKLSYLRSPIWWIGIILMSCGEFCNFLAYGFAPASVVAPLGTVALISNCGVAPLILGEQFHKRDLLGVALAVIGTITVVISTSYNSQSFDPHQLLKAISQIPFIIYVCLCILVMTLLGILSNSNYAQRFIVIDLGICCILGGFTVLSTKALSSLLNQMFLECFTYPISWLVLAILIITAITQVIFLNRALQQFDSKHVVPVQFVLFTIFAIIGSSILYQDFNEVSSAGALNFVFGCLFIFIGVYVLTCPEEEPKSGEEEEEEEGPVLNNSTSSSTPNYLSRVTLSSVNEEEVLQNLNPTKAIPVKSCLKPHFNHTTSSTCLNHHHHQLNRRQSQPTLTPRAIFATTPAYYLIAATRPRMIGMSRSVDGGTTHHYQFVNNNNHHMIINDHT